MPKPLEQFSSAFTIAYKETTHSYVKKTDTGWITTTDKQKKESTDKIITALFKEAKSGTPKDEQLIQSAEKFKKRLVTAEKNLKGWKWVTKGFFVKLANLFRKGSFCSNSQLVGKIIKKMDKKQDPIHGDL